MENPELNEMCQKYLWKSLDETLADFDKSMIVDSEINKPITVMELKVVSYPGAVAVIGSRNKLFGSISKCDDQLQESLKRCNDVLREEAVKIAEKLYGVAAIVKSEDFKE